jgi:hypothetical protein
MANPVKSGNGVVIPPMGDMSGASGASGMSGMSGSSMSGMTGMTEIQSMINVTALPLTDPSCNSTLCQAFYDECKMQALGQDLYGAYTAGLYCLVILLFMIRYARRLILNRFPSDPYSRTSFPQKVHSLHRFWSYRQTTGWVGRWVAISYGAAALMILFAILVLVAAFAERPYYRICTTWGMPPPLANRTGAMAISLTPLVIILAQKWNVCASLP